MKMIFLRVKIDEIVLISFGNLIDVLLRYASDQKQLRMQKDRIDR